MSDLIDRQAAIDVTWEEPSYTDPLNVLTEVRDRIKALPSAQPERKKGKWITQEFGSWAECSECHELYDIPIACSNFCPHCGVDMRGEQDE